MFFYIKLHGLSLCTQNNASTFIHKPDEVGNDAESKIFQE